MKELSLCDTCIFRDECLFHLKFPDVFVDDCEDYVEQKLDEDDE